MILKVAYKKYQFECFFILWVLWCSYALFDSFFVIPLVIVLSLPLYFVIQTSKKQNKQMKMMQTMKSLFAQLALETSSGNHYDNALKIVVSDHLKRLEALHPLESALIELEKKCLYRLMNIHVLFDFIGLLEMPDLIKMVQLMASALETGHHVVETQTKLSQMISDSIHQQEEILILMTRKKLELIIMSFVPGIALIMVRMASSDYLEALTNTINGILLLSFALLIMNLAIVAFNWNQNQIMKAAR